MIFPIPCVIFQLQGGRNDWLKGALNDKRLAIKPEEIILLRPLPDHPQSNLAAYTSRQVEADLLSRL